MNIVFLMDPIESITPEKDTTLTLMRECQDRNYTIFWCGKNDFHLYNNTLTVTATKVTVHPNNRNYYTSLERARLSQSEIHCLWIRTDPPFDQTYLENTWFLDTLNQTSVVMNNPTGIRSANEKLWTTQFSKYIPETLISSSKTLYLDFLTKHKTVILKPLNGFGGAGIFKVSQEDTNKHVTFETLSKQEKEPIIIQSYINESKIGDKRILLCNGEPLGAILRVHPKDDHRNNFFSGGKAEKTTITPYEKEIISTLKPKLQELGLYFVGIDIIGNYLIEINVTSPTCINELNELTQTAHEKTIINFMETLIKNKIDDTKNP